jgi:hypothetical protein
MMSLVVAIVMLLILQNRTIHQANLLLNLLPNLFLNLLLNQVAAISLQFASKSLTCLSVCKHTLLEQLPNDKQPIKPTRRIL